MTSKHCDLLLDYFNNQLSLEEKQTFEMHLSECKACRVELEEFQQLTDELPYSSEPVEPPADMKKRVLSNILASEDEASEKTETIVELPPEKNEPKVQRKRWAMPTMAALLTLSLIGNGVAAIYLSNADKEPDQAPDGTVSLENLQAMKVLQPAEGSNAQATALLLKQDNGLNLILQANGLPELTGEETYQVWVLEDGTPYRAGNFTPGEDGNGNLSHLIDYEGEHNWDTIAITKEPNKNSQVPQGDILLSSPL